MWLNTHATSLLEPRGPQNHGEFPAGFEIRPERTEDENTYICTEAAKSILHPVWQRPRGGGTRIPDTVPDGRKEAQ